MPIGTTALDMALFAGQATAAGGGDHPSSDLLLESGSFLLQEDGTSTLVQEA